MSERDVDPMHAELRPALPTGKAAPRPDARMGRPSKLSAETLEHVLRAVRAGSSFDAAAAFAGISRSTFHNWLRRGRRQKRGEYRDFLDRLEKANAEVEVRYSARVLKAADEGHWTAAAWWLERRNPRAFGRKDQIRHANEKGTGPVEFVLDLGRVPKPVQEANRG